MSRQDRDNQRQEPNHNTPPSVNIGDAETSQIVQETERGYIPTNNHTDKPKVNKQWLLNKDNQPIIANIISFLMFGATIGLVFYTVGLFKKTSIQAKAAMTADSIAQIQLDSMRSAKIQSDIADAAKTKRDTEFINKQKTGINAQIKAFKETEKEFEISHSPYIEVVNYKLNSNSLSIGVENEGTQIAWAIESDVKIKADIPKRKFKDTIELRKWLPISLNNRAGFQKLLGPGKPIGFDVSLDSLSENEIQDVKSGKKVLFVRVIIYYFNYTKRKSMTMESISMVNATNGRVYNLYFGYKVLKKYPE